jgi:hypothetical protein
MNKTSLAFSIHGKQEFKIENTPGPGDYQAREYKTSGFSFGHRRSDKIDETPGPGAYKTYSSVVSGGKGGSSNPSWSMPGRARLPYPRDVSPGPGQYSLSSTNDQKSCTISKLGRNFSANKNPGPGEYEQKSYKPIPSYSQGKGSRTDFTKLRTSTPGPAAYSVLTENTPYKGKFSTAARELKLGQDSGPLYKIDLKPDGPHYSLQGKRSENKPSGVPGPGSYSSDLKHKKASPSFTMGARRNLFSRGRQKNFTPVRNRNK